MRRLITPALFVLASVTPAVAVPAETDPVRKLIADLGADTFQRREHASKELLKIGERALPELAKAAKSPNTEVATRAEKLICRIKESVIEKETNALLGEIAADGLKEFVTKMVGEKDGATDARWKAVERLGERARELSEKAGGGRFLTIPAGSGAGNVVRQLTVGTNSVRVLHDGATRATGIQGSTVVSKGPIVQATSARDSVVIVAGDFRATVLKNSVVICSGHVRTTSFENCVILCNGALRTNGGKASFIRAGEGATGSFDKCVLYNTEIAGRLIPDQLKAVSEKEDRFRPLLFKESTPSTLGDLKRR